MIKISVLLATFNRKEKTLSCLNSLFAQELGTDITFDVFLTDDNSTDGTPNMIRKQFPVVNLFEGSGSLFWAGGMRNTWNEALKFKPDYYLLLNDDTILNHDAISELLRFNKENTAQKRAICIGTTKDRISGQISYGGQKLYNKKSIKYHTFYSDTEYLECDMANANIMLVPEQVVTEIGILSQKYTHSIADLDYTLRARKAGYKIIVIPGIVGFCTDDHGNNWKSADTTLVDRIKYLKSPKGLAYNEYLYFIKQHFPSHLPTAFVKLWAKTLFPVIWDKLK
ncbi:glycosyltransferase family 2 protein [Mucilaginibacter sp. UYCu711]|uniref:glycosyltransferase family 2 protein n=1 Tax=Mucilaginibacter sp. UYCu711 TaxID=3156339 RepID=UPI003D1E0245